MKGIIQRVLCGVLILSSSIVFAQHGNIRGTIKTSDDQPGEFVNVGLKGTSKGTTANERGEYEIRDIHPGTYTLVASFVGLESKEQTIEVKAGETVTVLEIILKENAQTLKEVVVSAEASHPYVEEKPSSSLRLKTDLIEVPQNIVVTTKQTIRDMGMVSKPEIMRTVSGITKTYGEDLDASFLIRGTNSSFSTYRNGIGGPLWMNAQEDAAMIEKVEFVKGPAGFFLANSEPGGLINIVTKQPVADTLLEAGITIGSFSLMRATVDMGGPLNKKRTLTYRLNLGYQRSGTYYEFGDLRRFFFCPVLKYDFSDKTSITLEHNYVNTRTQEVEHRMTSINGKMFALPSSMAIMDPNFGYFTGADAYTRVALKHQINDAWTLNAQAGTVNNLWDGYNQYINHVSATKDTIYRTAYYSDFDGSLMNAQVFLDGKFETGKYLEHNVLIGGDFGKVKTHQVWADTWAESNKYPLVIADPVYFGHPDSLKTLEKLSPDTWGDQWQAVYVQDHLKIAKRVILTLAGRYTYLVSSSNWNYPDYEKTDRAFTPRGGITVLLSDHFSFYGLYDQSFLPQQGRSYTNEKFKPLTGTNTEAGVKGYFLNRKLAVSASVYDIKKNDVLVEDLAHPGFFIERGQISSTGVEVDVIGNITRELSVIANYAYANARITKDEIPEYIGLKNLGTPDHAVNVFIKYRFPENVLKGFAIAAGTQYMGNRGGIYAGDFLRNEYLEGYTVYDASLSYSTRNFDINLNVYNLTNEQYATTGSLSSIDNEWTYVPGVPTNFRLQTQIRF